MNGEAVVEIANLVKRPEVMDAGNGVQWLALPAGWTSLDPTRAPPKPLPLSLHTLSGLSEYLRANRDALVMTETIVNVSNPRHVSVLSKLLPLAQRHCFLEAQVNSDDFGFGRFYDCESFVIALQVLFEQTEDAAALLALVGNIKDEKVATHDDDGVTQTVTARQGVVLAQNVKAPNPVTLRPYRTFREVEQPASKFVFRMQAGKEGAKPLCALFEADGGRWKLEAVQGIAAFLRANVPGEVTVLA